MSKSLKFAGGSAVLLSLIQAARAGDYDPMTPARPSPGLFNEFFRKSDPYREAWDIGAQVRLRYEIKDNFGVTPASDFRKNGFDNDNSYFLHRVKVHLGYTDKWFSAFVEGRESGTTGDDRDPNPEADSFDLHQAWVTVGNHKEFPLSLKVGRQELIYGEERLVGTSDWANISRVFDAVKVRWQNSWFGADLFSGRVIIPRDKYFNMPNDYDWFSGLYLASKKIPKQTTEAYFLSRNTGAKSPTVNGVGQPAIWNGPSARDIYTLGFRMKSNPDDFCGWDYSLEAMKQFGHFKDPALPKGSASLEHDAYALILQAGYTWTNVTTKPRVGFEYDYGSGDSNPTDGKHGTFENLFPTNHKYYGFMDTASLQNIHDIRLTSSLKPVARLSLSADYHLFWLADTHDNYYAVNGARRGGIGVTPGTGYGINPGYGSYVGSEIDLVANYQISPVMGAQAGFGHFFRGDYVKESFASPAFGSEDANWVYLQFQINL